MRMETANSDLRATPPDRLRQEISTPDYLGTIILSDERDLHEGTSAQTPSRARPLHFVLVLYTSHTRRGECVPSERKETILPNFLTSPVCLWSVISNNKQTHGNSGSKQTVWLARASVGEHGHTLPGDDLIARGMCRADEWSEIPDTVLATVHAGGMHCSWHT